MTWDVKLAVYSFLIYIMFGVGYLLSDGDFVPPLPMLYILVPVVSVGYLVGTKWSKYSIFFLLLPLLFLSEILLVEFREFYVPFIMLSLLSWAVLGVVMLIDRQIKNNIWVLLLEATTIAFPIMLLLFQGNVLVRIVMLTLLLVETLVLYRMQKEKLSLPITRILMLIGLISGLYLVTVGAAWLM